MTIGTLLFATILVAVPAQSIDSILAAAAKQEAERGCTPAANDELIVCGDRDAGERYRLPLPNERTPQEMGAVVGEAPRASTQDPFLSGCGMFRGQGRCSRKEAEAYGYGRGRDPVTLVGRLVRKAIDPDAEIGPPPTLPPRSR